MTSRCELLFKSISREEFEKLLVESGFSPRERQLTMRMYRLSKNGHRAQKREGGDRYFEHPKSAAILQLRLGVRDAVVTQATLGHDLLEDTWIMLPEDMQEWFGNDVFDTVISVTKKPDVPHEEQLAALQSAGPRAWLVKVTDRLHNLFTLVDGNTPAERERFRLKKLKQVKETRQYILPLAHKLAADEKYASIGQWFVEELTYWCDRREREATDTNNS